MVTNINEDISYQEIDNYFKSQLIDSFNGISEHGYKYSIVKEDENYKGYFVKEVDGYHEDEYVVIWKPDGSQTIGIPTIW